MARGELITPREGLETENCKSEDETEIIGAKNSLGQFCSPGIQKREKTLQYKA